MSLREATAVTVLDLVCLDVNCLYSVGSTYNDLLENLCDSYNNPELYDPKKFVLNPGIKSARQEYTCSPYIRDRDNMLVAYVNNKKASGAEIVRSTRPG